MNSRNSPVFWTWWLPDISFEIEGDWRSPERAGIQATSRDTVEDRLANVAMPITWPSFPPVRVKESARHRVPG
jgi:hypothetical protein